MVLHEITEVLRGGGVSQQEAKKFVICLLKQVGETIEYETEWVRAY